MLALKMVARRRIRAEVGLQNRESGNGVLRGEIKWLSGEMGRKLRRDLGVFGLLLAG